MKFQSLSISEISFYPHLKIFLRKSPYNLLRTDWASLDGISRGFSYVIKSYIQLNKGDLMKTTKILRLLNLNLFILSLLLIGTQRAGAECVSGSVSVKAPLYIVTVDAATRILTYQQQIGNVAKKAVLRRDCVGYTTYTITGTQNLPYSEGTQFVVLGKNDFNSPSPAAIYLTVVNGSINKTVTAAGAHTGINSDPFNIYLGSSMVMRVKQSWK